MSNPEVNLISAILKTGDFTHALTAGVSEDMFHSLNDEWAFLESYCIKHRRVPTRGTFKTKFPEFRLTRADDVGHCIDELREAHAQFSLVEMMDYMADAFRKGTDPALVLKRVNNVTAGIQASLTDGGADFELVSNTTVMSAEISHRVDKARKYGNGLTGIPTGWPSLDLATGGYQDGDLVVIGARLSNGKTWALVTSAIEAAVRKEAVQFHSLEQSQAQIAMRMHAFLSAKFGRHQWGSMAQMRGQIFSVREYERYLRTLKKYVKGALYITDQTQGLVNLNRIQGDYEAHEPTIGFIDYFGLLLGKNDDWRGAAEMVSAVKRLALNYEMPVITAAQINRVGAQGRDVPTSKDFADTDSLGRDADVAVIMRKRSARVVRMRLDKNRNGIDGIEWWCEFQPDHGIFREITGDEAQALIDEDNANASGA